MNDAEPEWMLNARRNGLLDGARSVGVNLAVLADAEKTQEKPAKLNPPIGGFIPPTAKRKPPGKEEEEFHQAVIEYARIMGWRTASFRKVRIARKDGTFFFQTPVQGDGKGWPDLFLTRGREKMFIEFKTPTGRVEPEQAAWHAALRLAGIPVHVVLTTEWDRIEVFLKR